MIHQFANNGLDIILDVNSAAVHLVDETTAALVHILTDRQESYTADQMRAPATRKFLEEALPETAPEEIAEITDAGIFLPGGIGTIDETFEVLVANSPS